MDIQTASQAGRQPASWSPTRICIETMGLVAGIYDKNACICMHTAPVESSDARCDHVAPHVPVAMVAVKGPVKVDRLLALMDDRLEARSSVKARSKQRKCAETLKFVCKTLDGNHHP